MAIRSAGNGALNWEPEPLRVLVVAGTRPEAIKLAPVMLAAAGHPALEMRLIATGQHPELFGAAYAAFGLVPDHDLALARPGDGIADLAVRIEQALLPILVEERPHLLLVQGDTTSAWAAANAAVRAGVPVGHVEAGLRSGDPNLPFPEERNRTEIDRGATLLFAPTDGAARNLLAEGVAGEVHITGNTGIDALLWIRDRTPRMVREDARRLVLVTVHRRENQSMLGSIGEGLRAIARRGDVRLVLPLHPNPTLARRILGELGHEPNVELIPALDYPEMVRMMADAHLLLTDSGGLQEEAPALGLPTLVLRDLTERPEALATGNLQLVGTRSSAIRDAAFRLLDDPAVYSAMARPHFPYGDGQAAPRIVKAILDHPFG